MATHEKMSMSVKTRLGLMMFLTYAFQGIWVIPLSAYLLKSGYTGTQVGSVYGTIALGCIISPIFVGRVADRFFNAEKVLGILNILAAVLLFLASRMVLTADGEPNFHVFYGLVLAHALCYMPTWALTNTVALNQCSNPANQFPPIRGMGTAGWIVVSMTCLVVNAVQGDSAVRFELSDLPLKIGAAIGLIAGLQAFFLPATPPKDKGGAGKNSIADILGLKALTLFKDRNFLVFAITSFLILFPGMFYWAFGNAFLTESGMSNSPAWQSSGQMTEIIFIFMMPLFFRRFGVKKMLLLGIAAWIARFACFALGVWDLGTGMMWTVILLGIMLHGPCFDFFFVTGQLYTNKKAPGEMQAQAQSLLTQITFGFGWLIGANVAGRIVDLHKTADGHAWPSIWWYPAGMAAFIMVFFFLFFRDKMMITQEAKDINGEEMEPNPDA
jgi:nucleoside transporter